MYLRRTQDNHFFLSDIFWRVRPSRVSPLTSKTARCRSQSTFPLLFPPPTLELFFFLRRHTAHPTPPALTKIIRWRSLQLPFVSSQHYTQNNTRHHYSSTNQHSCMRTCQPRYLRSVDRGNGYPAPHRQLRTPFRLLGPTIVTKLTMHICIHKICDTPHPKLKALLRTTR